MSVSSKGEIIIWNVCAQTESILFYGIFIIYLELVLTPFIYLTPPHSNYAQIAIHKEMEKEILICVSKEGDVVTYDLEEG